MPPPPTAGWRHPLVGLFLSFVAVAFITVILQGLRSATDYRPYTIFYLAAVAGIAGGWGLRLGLFTTLLAILVVDLFLLPPYFSLFVEQARDVIELVGLTVGAVVVAVTAGRLHNALASTREAVAARLALEERQDEFFRDVVAAVTQGRLLIADREEIDRLDDVPPPAIAGGPHSKQFAITDSAHLSDVRHAARAEAVAAGFSRERVASLELCVGEAVTNALKHGKGGEVRVVPIVLEGRRPSPGLRVVVSDRGPGMSTILLPRLALWRGYSTQKSMGLGFTMMLDLADRVLLCTDTSGTSVVIEMAATDPAEASVDDLLAAFPGMDAMGMAPAAA